MFVISANTAGGSLQFPLEGTGPWRIGRKAPCEIRIKDEYISSIHAELSLSPKGVLLRRLKDFNPVRVNGQDIETILLRPGDSFTIGKTVFCFLDPDAAEENSSSNLVNTRQVLESADSKSSADASAAHCLRTVSRIMACRDEGELAAAVLQMICDRLGADRAILARCGPGDQIRAVAFLGFADGVEIRRLISSTVLTKVTVDFQTVLVADVRESASLAEKQSVVQNGICAVACAPFLDSDSNITGLIYVDNQKRESKFEARDAELLIWAGHFYHVLAESISTRKRLEVQNAELKSAAHIDARMIVESPQMISVLERAQRIAVSTSSVLLLGDSGSGKERIASLIHRHSTRRNAKFIALNCAAIPETLFESEMFGHVKGAFSGAISDHRGAFVDASGGTLFLDEIGDMDLKLQAKLLRALEEKEVRPVGGSKSKSIDVRLICATNCDLQAAIKAGKFRGDLYFRIAGFSLEVPPLRHRRDDILPLARYFAQQISSGDRVLSSAAEARLSSYDWPGNVRELRSVVEAAAFMAVGNTIQATDLNLPEDTSADLAITKTSLLAYVERQHICKILQKLDGNITQAAIELGIARSTLVQKLKEFGLYRPGDTTGFR